MKTVALNDQCNHTMLGEGVGGQGFGVELVSIY